MAATTYKLKFLSENSQFLRLENNVGMGSFLLNTDSIKKVYSDRSKEETRLILNNDEEILIDFKNDSKISELESFFVNLKRNHEHK